MKLYCQISGQTFNASDDFKRDSSSTRPLLSYHPVFFYSTKDLLVKGGMNIRYSNNERYTLNEEKLLFLAMLNATQSVDWEVPAVPSVEIVKKHFENVWKTLSWYDMISGGQLKLPRMRVSHYNSNLENIGAFIQTWQEARKEWRNPTTRKQLDDMQEDREFRLQKLIYNNKSTDTYAAKLAAWAMDASGVEGEDRRRDWIEIISTKADREALSLDLDELEDIIAHMASLFDTGGSIQAQKLMEHLHKLKKIREGGMLAILSGEVGGKENTFRIKIDSLNEENDSPSEYQEKLLHHKEELEEQLLASGAPLEEPKREDFGSRISDWIRAKARWTLTRHLRDDLEYLNRKVET